ncbi:Putative porin [Hymenobacter gelipurpurascens]|uniref:Putative porin n=1 Tax=Hymenobacter gelipurpurascens TaxID=89968 RepID=A0A212T7R0_9BACT|nr:Putative porin [Hymenobacter gelipurpurascens]
MTPHFRAVAPAYWSPLVRPLLLLVLLLGLWPAAQAQIVDDSTKNRYGAHTTFILRESNLMRGDTVGQIIDSTLTRLPQNRYWVHDSAFYQDLGNFGTASRHLLWEPNGQLGARLGRNAFDRYARDASNIPYYDTRSPYTFFRFNQGNPYEQIFELSYARSIKKAVNVGFAFERFGSNKILAVSNPRAGQVEHTNFLLFLRYQNKNDRYHLMTNFSTARHRAAEQGGIVVQPEDIRDDGSVNLKQSFDYGDEEVRLVGAINRDDRDRFRLAHTYRLIGRGLTAYHVADWSRQQNKYTDDQLLNTSTGLPRYDLRKHSTTITDDRADYRQFENTVGVMGNTPSVAYRLYGKVRNYKLESRVRKDDTDLGFTREELQYTQNDGPQLFLGGTAAFRYKQFAIEAAGEVKVPGKFKEIIQIDQTEYRFTGLARLGPLSGELLFTGYSPTLTQQRLEGNHFSWDNTTSATEFSNTQVQQARVLINQKLGNQYLQLVGTAANITGLVYYNEQAVPAQLDDERQVLSIMARHRFNVGHFFMDNQATYTKVTGGTIGLQIPELVGESRLYYQGYVFKKALLGQVGVQTYFQSRWQPYDYSPSTQQFFIQDHFTIRNTPIADAFVSADIKTLSIFFKMAYINQFLPQSGYFTTPYYTGLPRRLQFGIRWQFFN